MTTYSGGNTNAGSTTASILGVPSTTPLSSFGGTVQPSNTSSPNVASQTAQQSTLQSLLGNASNPDGTFQINAYT